MQSNNQHKNQYHDNAFAEVVSHDEEEDQIGNIFNQGNLLLRNEESEFMHEDVDTLQDNFKSQSNSDDESNNGDKSLNQYTQVTPQRQNGLQQASRYGDLVISSPDMQQRHQTFMPVYTQEDEVDEVISTEQHIGNGRHLSGRNSGVSEEDFYGSSQYSQSNRIFPHDINIKYYGFSHLSQQSQQDIHHLNYQQQQSQFLHRGQYAHEQYYYKGSDKPLNNVTFSQDQEKQILEPSQKQDEVNDQLVVQAEGSSESYKGRVFTKIKLPSDDEECMEVSNNQQEAYPEQHQELSESKLLKSADIEQSAQVSSKIQEFGKMRESESCRVHSLNVNESSQTIDLKEQQKQIVTRDLKNCLEDSHIIDEVENINTSQIKHSDSISAFKIVKGKKRTARERKYFEKRRKLIEQVQPTIREIGSFEWDAFISKLQKLESPAMDKLNPFTQFNTSTFWYYVSTLYFPKCHENFLQERLCRLASLIRGDESNKCWEKNFRDHPTFIRKSWRLYAQTLKRIDRSSIKIKESLSVKSSEQKKKKDPKGKAQSAMLNKNPTQIEDLIDQLQADKEECTPELNNMLNDLLETIKSQKRPRLNDNKTEDNQLIQQIMKNVSCQQVISFNQELNNFSTMDTVEYLDLEQS